MPKATVDNSPKRYDLKSLPGAWVEIKRMSYGDWLKRTEMALKMQVQQQRKGGGQTMDVTMEGVKLAIFECKRCVVNHNLTVDDEETMPINLNSEEGIMSLDPQIGNEISDIIEALHAPVEDTGNSKSESEAQ